MSKSIYFIRHGYALHNDLFWSIGKDAYKKYQDTPLLHKGYLQANDCKKKYVKPWNGRLKNIDIVKVLIYAGANINSEDSLGDTEGFEILDNSKISGQWILDGNGKINIES